MRNLGARALLIGILLCVLFFGLVWFHGGMFPAFRWFMFPGMLAMLYAVGIDGLTGFDPQVHPTAALFIIVAADVFFWWLVIYGLLRLLASRRKKAV